MRLRTHALTNSLAGAKPQHTIFPRPAFPCGLLFHHVKERASRTQNESSLSSFAEAMPLFEAQPQSPFPFVDIAKLRTKKMRSNLLKRIQKQNSESPSKNRNYWYQTFCMSETKSETSSEIPLKRSPGLMHRSPSIYPHEDAYRDDC